MAVAILATDTWIQHLVFSGGRRTTPFGPVDGVFYGLVSGVGDASAGNLTLNGRLSAERKEDWVYIIGAHTVSVNTVAGVGDVFTQLNSGPLIPTSSSVQNPSFNRTDASRPATGNAIAMSDRFTGGGNPFAGMPIFGDKRIPGVFLMAAAGFETNVNLAEYQMSLWGWIIRYNGFFRNEAPSLG